MNIADTKRLETILMVEDEDDHARIIRKALTDQGKLLNEIIRVKNGKEALDYMNREGDFNEDNAPIPGLILLDIKLPFKDGFDVLSELKSDQRFKHIPVVMLTTTSNVDDVRKALDNGANDYIVKPVSFSEFTEKVGKLGNYWAFVSDSALSKNG